MSARTRKRFGLLIYACVATVGLAGAYFARQADQERLAATLADKQKISDLHAALEARENAIAPLLASSNFGWAVLDRHGKVREWNPAMEKMTGYTQDEMLGNGIDAVMPADKRESHNQSFAERLMLPKEKVAAETLFVNCDVIHRDLSRKPIPVRVSVRVVFPSNDDNDRYVIALIDKANKIVEIGETRQ